MKKVIFSFVMIFALFACSSDDDSSDNGDDIFITFKANGTSYTMEPYTSKSMEIYIAADQGLDETYREIQLRMPVDFSSGSHPIVDSYELEDYKASYTEGDITIDGTSGTLHITSIDGEYIEGTFEFEGEDEEGTIYNITEGAFKTYNIE